MYIENSVKKVAQNKALHFLIIAIILPLPAPFLFFLFNLSDACAKLSIKSAIKESANGSN